MLTTTDLLVISLSSLAALGMIATVFAWSWKGWLELKRHQSDIGRPEADLPPATRHVAGRIELADLRERVRKLEAIAAGVDM